MDMLFSTTQVKRSLAPFLTLLLCLFLAFPLLGQKKVVLTDSKNDPYINNSEGYWNGKSKPGDKYEKGGDLEKGMGCVSDGDTLVIIAHGTCTPGTGGAKSTYGMEWGDSTYTGVGGTGGGQMPVPPGFDTLENVHIICQWCWSDKDPDGAGPCKSMCDQLGDAAGGANKRATAGTGTGNGTGGSGTGGTGGNGNGNGNTKKGYKGLVVSNINIHTNCDSTKTAQIGQKANGNKAWQSNPPPNRKPPVTPNQLTALKDMLKACGLDETCVTGLSYPPPVDKSAAVIVPIGTRGQTTVLKIARVQSTSISAVQATSVCGETRAIAISELARPISATIPVASLAIYPNPIQQQSRIIFTLPVDDHVVVDLFDVMGNRVMRLYEGGTHAETAQTLLMPLDKLKPGRYFCRIAGKTQNMTKHFIKE